MKKNFFILFTLVFSLLTILTPNYVSAYSYGNPNEEVIATAYTDMIAALLKASPDYPAVQAIFDSIKDEMVKEFGPEKTNIIQQGITNRDSDMIINEMKDVLIRNIGRRFFNIEESFDDYPQAKILLAKARATYVALSPEVAIKNPELDQSIYQAFDKALESLGNPGLFGVGKIEPNREMFDKNREYILAELKDFFQTEGGYLGHTGGTGLTNIDVEETRSWGNWVPLSIILFVIIVAIVLFTRKG
ncbi:hypothetical protein BHF71_04085 [Vulcanibacillus modesticaldus]|uniref:Sporulation protein YpjB n=1 Tax=Vulcanibacillus modesticaldus TaxID=337097 RepID=A0A1D2YS94_9BACI|nr:hypothetical protein [Vulcanibacillus modesticaldus]OEF96914.1 hypothetical protein BHF71_04085 [Vulcanibacillus modesticaldus]